jgi:hypothetical protein
MLTYHRIITPRAHSQVHIPKCTFPSAHSSIAHSPSAHSQVHIPKCTFLKRTFPSAHPPLHIPKWTFLNCTFPKCTFPSAHSQVRIPQVHIPQVHIPKWTFLNCTFPKCTFPSAHSQVRIPQVHIPQVHIPQCTVTQNRCADRTGGLTPLSPTGGGFHEKRKQIKVHMKGNEKGRKKWVSGKSRVQGELSHSQRPILTMVPRHKALINKRPHTLGTASRRNKAIY